MVHIAAVTAAIAALIVFVVVLSHSINNYPGLSPKERRQAFAINWNYLNDGQLQNDELELPLVVWCSLNHEFLVDFDSDSARHTLMLRDRQTGALVVLSREGANPQRSAQRFFNKIAAYQAKADYQLRRVMAPHQEDRSQRGYLT